MTWGHSGSSHYLSHRFCPHFPSKHWFPSHCLVFNKHLHGASLVGDRSYCKDFNICKSASIANACCENPLYYSYLPDEETWVTKKLSHCPRPHKQSVVKPALDPCGLASELGDAVPTRLCFRIWGVGWPDAQQEESLASVLGLLLYWCPFQLQGMVRLGLTVYSIEREPIQGKTERQMQAGERSRDRRVEAQTRRARAMEVTCGAQAPWPLELW